MRRIVKPLEVILGFAVCLTLFLLAFNVPMTRATQNRIHDLGDFQFNHRSSESLNTNSNDPTGEWPQDVYRSANVTFINHMRFVESWMDETGAMQSKTVHGGASYQDQLPPYMITEHRRFKPPEVEVFADGVWQIDSRRYEEVVDPSLPCDEMIVNRYKASPGLDVVCRSYSLSNQNNDDYIIFERTYTFTGDNDQDPELEVNTDYGLHGLYFVIGYCMQTAGGTYISYSRWYEEGMDEWTNYEEVPSTLVPGSRDLVVSYSWDGDHPGVVEFEPGDGGGPNGSFDDTGDPRWGYGSGGRIPMPSAEFVSATYNGFAVLHADQSASIKSDDVTQPYSIISNVSIYNLWGDDFGGQYGSLWDWANSGLREGIDKTPGWPDNPDELEGDYPFQAIGPYDMALGDSIKIVHVLSSKGISRDLSISKGLEWRSWYRGEAGATFDDAAKNNLLATGRDSLFEALDRAAWAWSRGMDVPDPLPAPNLKVISGPNRIDLEWEDMSDVGDPDTGVPDLDHYNIYRKRGSYLEDTDEELRESGVHERWQFITSVPASQTTYSDENVIRGEAYHYAVTAVDDGTQNTTGLFPGQKLESSRYKNRNYIPAKAFQPGEDNTENILIVPNPFISGADDFNFLGNRSNTILFVNLPPYCTLSIYTVTGDLIKKIDHVDGSADAEWDLITQSNQYVASGIYILRISDATYLDGSKLPDTIEKFVVVR